MIDLEEQQERPKSLNLSPRLEEPCVECHATTDAVMLFDGEANFLCVSCQLRIRLEVA